MKSVREAKEQETGKTLASRRSVFKGLGSGALVAAVPTALSHTTSAQGTLESTSTYDWICVGSGAGGLAAAIRGHDLKIRNPKYRRSSTPSRSNPLLRFSNVPSARPCLK